MKPRGLDGKTALKILALASQGCNGHKYIKTEALDPATKKRVALFHPRKQKWNERFRWSEDFTLILGVTATGRATVTALRLSHENLKNLRRALYALGKHPPSVLNSPDNI